MRPAAAATPRVAGSPPSWSARLRRAREAPPRTCGRHGGQGPWCLAPGRHEGYQVALAALIDGPPALSSHWPSRHGALLVKSSASGDLSQVRRPPPPPSRIAIRPWRCSALLSAVDYSQRRPHPESPFASTLRAVQAAKRRPVSAGPRSLPPSHSAERTASRPAPPPLRAASPPASGLCAGAHSGTSSRAGPGEWRKRGDGAAVCGARTGQGLPATQAQSTPQRRGTPRHAAAQSITLAQCAAVAASRAAQLVRIDAERSGARKPCCRAGRRNPRSQPPAGPPPPISSYQVPRQG